MYEQSCTERIGTIVELNSLATVTLLARNSEHNPNQINKRPTFGTAARYGGGEDRVLYVYSLV